LVEIRQIVVQAVVGDSRDEGDQDNERLIP
jgi:hypothetical protein